jgi:peptidoglycan/LPS O-acetylase OafA/YrhL
MNENYKPYLDGVRGISILLVAISHAGFGGIIPGGLGVTIFFFISGYLITSLLLKEVDAAGEVRLIDFYMRRLWRLMPAFGIYLLASVVLIISLDGQVKVIEFVSAALYFSNYYNVFYSYDQLAGTHSPYGVLWSLAVEEHFYLFFAPMVALLKNKKKLLWMSLFLIAIPLVIRCFVVAGEPSAFSEDYTYHATDTRIDSIAYGCLLAVLGNRGLWRSHALLALTLGGAGLLLSLVYRDEQFRQVLRYSLQGMSLYLIFGAMIYAEPAALLRRALSVRPLVFVGKLSYSLYLYHWLVLIIMMVYAGPVAKTFAWQGPYWVLSFALAALSYYLVERPSLRWRIRYGSDAR